ncbi:MAG: NAD(P)H-dependent oxidoreductase subunit E [Erysipelotrichaceae bacterium]
MEKLNGESLKKIDLIVETHKNRLGPVKLMLHDVQKQLGYIPFEAMVKISEGTNVPVAKIYGVVTFYSQFCTQPKGKHIVNVCMGTACYVKGAANLLEKVGELIGSKVNGTSDDNVFSLDATRCVGACGLAPVVVIDGQVFGNADANKAVEDHLKMIIASERNTI